ncbi:unnamed protein product [Paramecium sonneborni]|uniref:Uncharacterized protein n=1 Tax=Paramecium sonneborni TaxID=65129 RepID=A0A8S1Q156_9CILI|nr:unnamed protein product [Paramecium sonneborni]
MKQYLMNRQYKQQKNLMKKMGYKISYFMVHQVQERLQQQLHWQNKFIRIITIKWHQKY